MIRELQRKFTLNSISITSGLDYQNISEISFPAVTINYPIDINYKQFREDMEVLYPDPKIRDKMRDI